MKSVAMAPHTTSVQMVSSGSIMKSDRRASKPLMEKRRRERINKSLNELKSILLNALRKDQSACHSKLEKADILEMTVRYLKTIQRQRTNPAMALDQNTINKYRSGFMECRNEVSQFVENSDVNMQPEIKARLLNHLSNSVPQPNLPPHLIGQAHRSPPRLLTTGPPVPAISNVSPLQIQMSPNTQFQHVMAATAAAMAQMRGRPHCMPFNMHELLEARNATRESQIESPALSPSDSRFSSSTTTEVRSPHHVRHSSSSSYTSSGFASPGLPSSITSHKFVSDSVNLKCSAQGSCLMIPQSTTTADSSSIPNSRNSEHPPKAVSPKKSYPASCVSPITPVSSPIPSPNATFHATRSLSPASLATSDSDCDSVWRPW